MSKSQKKRKRGQKDQDRALMPPPASPPGGSAAGDVAAASAAAAAVAESSCGFQVGGADTGRNQRRGGASTGDGAVATAVGTAGPLGSGHDSSHPSSSMHLSSSSSQSQQSSFANVSDNSAADGGFAKLNFTLRSILFHPVALLLLSFFHGVRGKMDTACDGQTQHGSDTLREFLHRLCAGNHSDKKQADDGKVCASTDAAVNANERRGTSATEGYQAALARFFSNEDQREHERFDGVLQKSYEAYQQRAEEPTKGPTEHFLTKALSDNIAEKLGPDSTLGVSHQYRLNVADSEPKKPDILIHHRRDEKDSIALLLEVGLEKMKKKSIEDDLVWWKKADQNAQYLDCFPRNQDSRFPGNQDSHVLFSGPMLFAVLTFVKTGNIHGGKASAFHSARLGVFLCAPRPGVEKPTPGFRSALLWREEFRSLDDASRGFGLVLRATRALAGLLHDFDGGCIFHNYQYLGPNCCRIGDKVLRAYDTRFRHTHRRPDLYGVPEIVPDAQLAFRIVDKNLLVDRNVEDEFKLWDGRGPVNGYPGKRLWPWQFQGELLVISTKFHDGLHFAKTPDDFTRIVEHLEKIHVAGYVHGDIRCANIVFGKWLIDFDMGGRLADEPKYPPGYVKYLDDGERTGQGGGLIKMSDDWYALLRILFDKHRLTAPLAAPNFSDLENRRKDFADRAESLAEEVDSLTNIRELASDLIDFLNAAEWELPCSRNFKTWAKGCRERMAARKSSDPATGSPEKPK